MALAPLTRLFFCSRPWTHHAASVQVVAQSWRNIFHISASVCLLCLECVVSQTHLSPKWEPALLISSSISFMWVQAKLRRSPRALWLCFSTYICFTCIFVSHTALMLCFFPPSIYSTCTHSVLWNVCFYVCSVVFFFFSYHFPTCLSQFSFKLLRHPSLSGKTFG